MADLVHRFLLFTGQLPVRVDCVLFEEEANLISGREEIVISNMVVVTCSEPGLIDKGLGITCYSGQAQQMAAASLTKGWSSTLNSSSSCFALSRSEIVSSGVRKPGRQRYLCSELK